MRNHNLSATCSLVILAALIVLTGCAEPRPEAPRPGQARALDQLLDRIDSTSIRSHLRFLSHDLLEGRGTGTRGEDLAVEYISAQMEAAGLEPAGDDGTYFQAVPLLGSTPAPRARLALRPETGEPAEFDFIDGYIASTDLDAESVTVTAPLVFVGYGIHAPAYEWDDYGDVDITGKVIVSFVNDPPATEDEPDLFQADTLTYFGRWTYKLEEARRRGATGALLIHTDETAGYPFTVLTAGARGEQIQLADVPENPLELRGWIPQPTAERLAEMSGSSLDEWFEMADTRDFTPVELPVTVSSTIDYEVRRFEGRNVLGIIRGTDRADEAIVFTAHHDHLGMDEQGNIYNGAIDNASGVSMMLTAARAFGASPPPRRSLLFVSVTAEESGLLGSAYYAQNPVIPMDRTVANINLDSGNVFGRTEDIVGLGSEKSELGLWFRDAAHLEGLTVTPDTQPGQGLYFRSDQLSFAREGVPAVFINTGNQFEGRPPGYFDEVMTDYRQNRYHQPADEFDPEWPMGGMVQQTRVSARLAHDLADSDAMPAYYPTEAFAEIRAIPEPAGE